MKGPLKDKALVWMFINENPEWYHLYACPRYTTDFQSAQTVSCDLADEDRHFAILQWCMENCKGKYSDYSELMGGGGDGVAFENEQDAIHFKMVWG